MQLKTRKGKENYYQKTSGDVVNYEGFIQDIQDRMFKPFNRITINAEDYGYKLISSQTEVNENEYNPEIKFNDNHYFYRMDIPIIHNGLYSINLKMRDAIYFQDEFKDKHIKTITLNVAILNRVEIVQASYIYVNDEQGWVRDNYMAAEWFYASEGSLLQFRLSMYNSSDLYPLEVPYEEKDLLRGCIVKIEGIY